MSHRNFQFKIETQTERIPDRKDDDYFDLYENPNWQPLSTSQKSLKRINRCVYALTSPKIVLSVLGIVRERACKEFTICITVARRVEHYQYFFCLLAVDLFLLLNIIFVKVFQQIASSGLVQIF